MPRAVSLGRALPGYLRSGKKSRWLHTDALGMLGAKSPRAAYRAYVHAGLDAPTRAFYAQAHAAQLARQLNEG